MHFPFVINKLMVVVVTHEFHSISIAREAGTCRIQPCRLLAWLPRSPPSSQPVRPAPHLVNISLHFLYQMITRLMACDVTLRSAAVIKSRQDSLSHFSSKKKNFLQNCCFALNVCFLISMGGG